VFVKIYASVFIDSNFYIKTFCHGDRRENRIALTFDDGPMAGNTESILKILKEKNVRATFFCIGKHIEKSEGLAKQIDADGHIIGNHSYDHGRFFDLQSWKKMNEELTKTDAVIDRIISKKPLLFRPPYGVTNPNLAKAVKERGYQTIGWSVRSFDTVSKGKNCLWKRITRRLRGGDVVLFHDYSQNTIELLSEFIDHVSKVGLRIAPLDEVLNVKAYA
jgi:peptidoglycan/xylan/chitin deacetylase (PgdA/CDA1 family)